MFRRSYIVTKYISRKAKIFRQIVQKQLPPLLDEICIEIMEKGKF